MHFLSGRVIVAMVTLVTASMLLSHPAWSEETVRSAQLPPTQQEPTRYEVITKGLLANPPFFVQFRSVPLRLEMRDLIMGPGRAEGVPTLVRTLMELRGGGVVTVINGERHERSPGDFWIVDRGSALSLQNAGDVAVIRAIQLFEGRK